MRFSLLGLSSITLALLPLAAGSQTSAQSSAADGAKLFAPIQQVLQHPRCQNCHIPGDAPLQYDSGTIHAQFVKRGKDGRGLPVMQCSACHQTQNSPAALGPHAPPGAPTWHLPPENMKMVFKDLSPRELCLTVKDTRRNGGKDLDAFEKHMVDDQLVAWGWNPGGNRKPVSLSKEATDAAVKAWVAAGAPCPAS